MEKMQGIHHEQRRTRKELANPNADLRCEKARTYGRGSVVEGHRRFSRQLRVMQRPNLRTTMSAAVAAELERQKVASEEEDDGKGGE